LTVLRISGPAAGAALDALAGKRPKARLASLRDLRDALGERLDQALVLWFPAPHSYTGEDCAELHLHGGRAVLAAVSDRLVELGLRPAEAGEFTRRAFLSGRMDLLEAEGIADLVAAETAAQRRQALRQLDGALGAIYRDWTARVTHLLAQQEALIDFPDEDLPPEVEEELRVELRRLLEQVGEHLNDNQRGERVRDGLVFAVAGPPNAGKSTLVNAVAQRDVAIVSPHAGTTRDILEVRIDLAGVAVTLVDMAGLRETTDAVEAEGVRRARTSIAQADLVIFLRAADEPMTAIDRYDTPGLQLTTKIDLVPRWCGRGLGVSAQTGAGMADLIRDLGARARKLVDDSGSPALTRPRHRAALMEASQRLRAAEEASWPELRAEDLRMALRAIGRITGAVGVEDVLDSIFFQFCIGK
jgi:tRNA modification GTPase